MISPHTNKFTTRALWILAVLIWLATAVRLWHVQTQSIWFDEGWSAYAAVQPSVLEALDADPTNPPLYYILLNLSTKLLGDSAFALRLFSAAWGILLLPLVYLLGCQLFDRRTGLISAWLAATLPVLWWAAQEARMYTLLAVLVTIAAGGWQRLLTQPDRRAWLMVCGGELALLYAHNTGPVIVGWLNAVTVLAWLVHRRVDRPDWRLWLGGQVVVALLWLPWFLARFVLVGAANSALVTPPQLSPDLFWRMWESLWAGAWAVVGREPLVTLCAAVLLCLTLLTLHWRSSNARWLLAHVLLLVAGLLAGLTILGNELHGRYLVMLVPLLLVALAAGLARLQPPVLRRMAVAACLLPLLVSVPLAQTPAYQHDDARSMVQYYAATLTSDDTVIAWSYADRYDLWYYWQRAGVQAQRVTLPEGADMETVLPLLPTQGKIALNIWYTQRADYRGMLDCLLRDGIPSWTDLPEITFNGMSSRTYPARSLAAPELRPVSGTFVVGTLSAMRDMPAGYTADQQLCLPLQFTPAQPISGELKARVTVRSADGRDVGTGDAIFATANQRTSVNAGELLTAYPLIRLEAGTPPGEYALYVRVYDEQFAPSGYDVLSAVGTPAGKDLPLGTWQTARGATWGLATQPCPAQTSGDDDLQVTVPAQNTTLHNGEVLTLRLEWRGCAPLPELTLAADDGTWTVGIPPTQVAHDVFTSDVRRAQIPLSARSGTATLRTPAGAALLTYTITAREVLTTAPPTTSTTSIEFPGVGRLVGFTIDPETPLPLAGEAFNVTLVWQAGADPIAADYTVFVQLLDAGGILIAQSDAQPVQNTRPTSTWLPGEYLVDTHTLRFNERAAPGEGMTLIAGLYTASSRLTLADGADFVMLAADLRVR